DVALRGLAGARQAGLQGSWAYSVLAADAAEALLAGGRTPEAAALIDPLTTGSPDRDHWPVYEARAELDLLRGDPGTPRRRPPRAGRQGRLRSRLGAARRGTGAVGGRPR